ncbi:MAG: hypothetical protein RL189_1173 [Pseudomonadota bacterium]
MNVIVIWQSLVVSAYRSFWIHAARALKGKVCAVVPHEFWELGGQMVPCAPFSDDWNAEIETHVLRVRAPHIQLVWFQGLVSVFRSFTHRFRNDSSSRPVLVALMEPYSPSALFVFLLARIFLPRSTLILFYSLQNIYKEFSLPLRLIQNFIFQRSSHILALSEEVSGVLRRQGFRGELVRFPLWADSSLFFLDASRAERGSRSENTSRVRVGFCGAVTESKGIVDLLDALELFSDTQLSAIHFEIAGGGPCLEPARNRLAALGRKGLSFTLHGPLPATALPEFFNSIDVLVVPSRTEKNWKEQFGRVIVEAWACGATVIGSNSGEIPVLLGQPELIFEERNPNALFQTLRNALSFEHNLDMRKKNAMRSQPFLDVTLARRFADELLGIQRDKV